MKITVPKAFGHFTLAAFLLIFAFSAFAEEEKVDAYGNIYSTNQGRVGIGISNPAYKLDVNGSIRVKDGGFFLSNGTDPVWSFMKSYGNYNWGYNILFNPGAELVIGAGESAYQLTNDGDAAGGSENLHLSADGSIFLWTGAQEGNQKKAVTINSTGNVGIGNGNPAYKLDVNGSIRVKDGGFLLSNGTDPVWSFMKTYGNYNWGYNILFNPGTELVIGAGESAYQLTNDGDASGSSENLHLSADDSIFLWSGAQGGNQKRAVTINSAGQIGIGTTRPDRNLVVGDPSVPYSGKLKLTGTRTNTWEANNLYFGDDGNTQRYWMNTRGGLADGRSWAMFYDNREAYSNVSGGALLTPILISPDYDGSNSYAMYFHNSAFNIISSGKVGIGTTSPNTKLDVNGVSRSKFSIISAGNATEGGQLTLADGGQYELTGESAQAWNIDVLNSRLRFHRSSSGEKLTITESGDVGIGTTNPPSKLAVNGTITAKEIKVESGWSDFVFDEDYDLASLDEVESFIHENKHLPDIPSAKEVEQQGVAVSEMLAKQMQKIEEMTLYLIQLKKENDELKERVAVLEGIKKSAANKNHH